MAPLPPLVDTEWKKHVTQMKAGPRFQEHIAPARPIEIGTETINCKTIALDKNSDAYAYVLKTWDKKDSFQQPFEDQVNLRYFVETKGSAPADGYPLFFAMHGGGQDKANNNNGSWRHMSTLYKGAISQGIYVSLRGVGNTWDLHFRPGSFVLIERLIENFILFDNVNPNQVYLLGFSAGGDGTYRVATRLAQRFGAVNAGGGHPGGVKFENLANLPMCLQVGEYDNKFKRCLAVASAAVEIDRLKSNYPKEEPVYQKEIFLHQPNDPDSLDRDDPDDKYIERHWEWESYNANITPAEYPKRGWMRVVDSYIDWHKNYIDSVPAQNTHFADTNAINWMITHNREDRSRPQRVVWDLRDGENFNWAFASNLSGRGIDGKGRSQHYWLDIGRYSRDFVGDLIEANINRDTSTITIVRAQNYLRILLVPAMFADPRKPVTVKVANQSFTVPVKWDDPKVVADTLCRNDPTLIFTGDIVISQKQGGDRKWSIGTAGNDVPEL